MSKKLSRDKSKCKGSLSSGDDLPMTTCLLLRISTPLQERKHRRKCLRDNPNSYFLGVKRPGCYEINTVFGHAQMVVLCVGCSTSSVSPQEEKQDLQKNAFTRKQH